MKRRAHLIPGTVVVLTAATILAQDNSTKDETTFRVETRLIEVNVVVQSSKGRAVTGLRREDFKLFDNGKEVPIDVFSAVPRAGASTSGPTTLPPNTYSNRMQGPPPNVVVVLLDGLNTKFEDQAWARAQVVRFLEELKPEDRVAIFLLSDHLYVLQTFTGDTRLLLKVLKSTRAHVPREPGTAAPTDSDSLSNITTPALPGPGGAEAREEAAMGEFEEHENSFFIRDRVGRTVNALTAIANYLSQFPGRKNLLWVSSAFPTAIGFEEPRIAGDTRDQEVFTEDVQSISKALNNADMAIYPVDARGLVALGWDASTSSARVMPNLAGNPAAANDLYASHGTMDELAEDTGGRAFYNTNGLAEAMRAAVDDSHSDYTLGFYPHVSWDGQYHELKVKVNRPGVHLRYRKGYYATRDIPEGEQQVNALFDRALHNPLDSTAIGLTVTLQNLTTGPTKRASLRIMMDPHDINFQDQFGAKTAQLDMVFAQLGADGKVLKSFRQTEDLRIAEKGMNNVLSRGIILGRWLGLVNGATTLELVVRDPASGNIGSVRIPLGT